MQLTLLAPVLSSLLSGPGPDDDNLEGRADWALMQPLYAIASPLPFMRDVVPVALKKARGERSYGYRFSPLASIGESTVKVASDAHYIAKGKPRKLATRWRQRTISPAWCPARLRQRHSSSCMRYWARTRRGRYRTGGRVERKR